MKNIIYAAFAAIILTFALTAYSDAISNDLENNLIRLHIIANSDSESDQTVKLKIRDAIIKEVDCKQLTPEQAAKKSSETANRILTENGFNYTATGEFCTAVFPKKEYKELTLPAGKYKAVRITLGHGKGHNWWCVLYPPVCMADIDGSSMSDDARSLLKEKLDEETYNLVTDSKKTKIKFKTVELINKLKNNR